MEKKINIGQLNKDDTHKKEEKLPMLLTSLDELIWVHQSIYNKKSALFARINKRKNQDKDKAQINGQQKQLLLFCKNLHKKLDDGCLNKIMDALQQKPEKNRKQKSTSFSHDIDIAAQELS